MPTRRSPSVIRILQADYATLLCVLGPVVAWALALGLWVMGRVDASGGKDPTFMVYLACAATAIGVPLFALRVRGFFKTFRDGEEVEGEVTAIGFYKDRGTVTYAFPWKGRRREVSRGIHKTARTEALKEGAPVAVIVDPNNPGGALLRDLFV